MSSRIMARVRCSAAGENAPIVKDAQHYAVNCVRSFPFALKYHLTEDGGNPHIHIPPSSKDPEVQRAQDADLKAALAIALRAELHQIWDVTNDNERAFMDRIMAPDVGNRPLQVLHELSLLNGDVLGNPDFGSLDMVAATEMDRSLQIFQNILGACEKILRTPIYSPYSKLTCRACFVWCTFLPLALFPQLGIGTVPVSLVISFFMLGIEDIGSRVEQPFNVMPLWQYCQVINTSGVQIVRATEAHLNRKSERLSEERHVSGSEFEDIKSESLFSWADPLNYDAHEEAQSNNK